MTAVPPSPSPEAIIAADTWSDAGNLNLEQLALAFDHFAAEAVAREREELLNALMRLTSDVSGVFGAYERGLREVMGNTNYTVIIKYASEARVLINRARGDAARPAEPPGEG